MDPQTDPWAVVGQAPVAAAPTPKPAGPSNSPDPWAVVGSAPASPTQSPVSGQPQSSPADPIHIDDNMGITDADGPLTRVGKGVVDLTKRVSAVGAGVGDGLLDTLNGGATMLHLPHATLEDAQHRLELQNSENPVLNKVGKLIESGTEFAGGDAALKSATQVLLADKALEGMSAAEKLKHISPALKAMKEHSILASMVTNGLVGGGQALVKSGGNVGKAATEGLTTAATAGVVGKAGEAASELLGKIMPSSVNIGGHDIPVLASQLEGAAPIAKSAATISNTPEYAAQQQAGKAVLQDIFQNAYKNSIGRLNATRTAETIADPSRLLAAPADMQPYQFEIGGPSATEQVTHGNSAAGVNQLGDYKPEYDVDNINAKPDHVTLYRGEQRPGTGAGVPDWMAGHDKYEANKDAAGRWFTPSLDDAKWYSEDAGDNGRITSVQVPRSELENYSALQHPDAKKFVHNTKVLSGQNDEYFLPRSLASSAQEINPAPISVLGRGPNPNYRAPETLDQNAIQALRDKLGVTSEQMPDAVFTGPKTMTNFTEQHFPPKSGTSSVVRSEPSTFRTSDPKVIQNYADTLQNHIDSPEFKSLDPAAQQESIKALGDAQKQLSDFNAYKQNFTPTPQGEIDGTASGIKDAGGAVEAIQKAHKPVFTKLDELSGGEWTKYDNQLKGARLVLRNPNTVEAYDEAAKRMTEAQAGIDNLFEKSKGEISKSDWEAAKSGWHDSKVLDEVANATDNPLSETADLPVDGPVLAGEQNLDIKGNQYVNRLSTLYKNVPKEDLDKVIGEEGRKNLFRVGALLKTPARQEETKNYLGELIGVLGASGLGAATGHAEGGVVAGGAIAAGSLAYKAALRQLATNPRLGQIISAGIKNKIAPKLLAPIVASTLSSGDPAIEPDPAASSSTTPDPQPIAPAPVSTPKPSLPSYDGGPLAGKPVAGMVKQGNIDLNHRPQIKNDDGSSSTIFSMTVPVDKSGAPVEWESKDAAGYALVPSIANGKFLTPNGKMPAFAERDDKELTKTQRTQKHRELAQLEQAATQYYGKTREHLGTFKTADDADRYAGATHAYGADGTNKIIYTPSTADAPTQQ